MRIGIAQVCVCVLTLVMCKPPLSQGPNTQLLRRAVDVFGKMNRDLMRRYDILEVTGLGGRREREGGGAWEDWKRGTGEGTVANTSSPLGL